MILGLILPIVTVLLLASLLRWILQSATLAILVGGPGGAALAWTISRWFGGPMPMFVHNNDTWGFLMVFLGIAVAIAAGGSGLVGYLTRPKAVRYRPPVETETPEAWEAIPGVAIAILLVLPLADAGEMGRALWMLVDPASAGICVLAVIGWALCCRSVLPGFPAVLAGATVAVFAGVPAWIPDTELSGQSINLGWCAVPCVFGILLLVAGAIRRSQFDAAARRPGWISATTISSAIALPLLALGFTLWVLFHTSPIARLAMTSSAVEAFAITANGLPKNYLYRLAAALTIPEVGRSESGEMQRILFSRIRRKPHWFAQAKPALLDHPSPAVRALAVELGCRFNLLTISELMPLATSPNRELSNIAIGSIRYCNPPPALDEIRPYFASPGRYLKEALFELVGDRAKYLQVTDVKNLIGDGAHLRHDSQLSGDLERFFDELSPGVAKEYFGQHLPSGLAPSVIKRVADRGYREDRSKDGFAERLDPADIGKMLVNHIESVDPDDLGALLKRAKLGQAELFSLYKSSLVRGGPSGMLRIYCPPDQVTEFALATIRSGDSKLRSAVLGSYSSGTYFREDSQIPLAVSTLNQAWLSGSEKSDRGTHGGRIGEGSLLSLLQDPDPRIRLGAKRLIVAGRLEVRTRSLDAAVIPKDWTATQHEDLWIMLFLGEAVVADDAKKQADTGKPSLGLTFMRLAEADPALNQRRRNAYSLDGGSEPIPFITEIAKEACRMAIFGDDAERTAGLTLLRGTDPAQTATWMASVEDLPLVARRVETHLKALRAIVTRPGWSPPAPQPNPGFQPGQPPFGEQPQFQPRQPGFPGGRQGFGGSVELTGIEDLLPLPWDASNPCQFHFQGKANTQGNTTTNSRITTTRDGAAMVVIVPDGLTLPGAVNLRCAGSLAGRELEFTMRVPGEREIALVMQITTISEPKVVADQRPPDQGPFGWQPPRGMPKMYRSLPESVSAASPTVRFRLDAPIFNPVVYRPRNAAPTTEKPTALPNPDQISHLAFVIPPTEKGYSLRITAIRSRPVSPQAPSGTEGNGSSAPKP